MNTKNIIESAYQCIILEAQSWPSLGLVSEKNSGCHTDMDFSTFVQSAGIFKAYFQMIVQQFDTIKTFNDLRAIGVTAQSTMFKVTNGINTHKGLIFAFGIYFYTYLYAQHNHLPFRAWPKFISNFVKPLSADFSKQVQESAGLKLYRQHHLQGARGEALKGYIIVNHAIKFLNNFSKAQWSPNESQLIFLLLLFFYRHTKDTTAISKIGYKAYRQSRIILNRLYNKAIKNYQKAEKEIEVINQWAIENRISPGGCADLVTLTLFIWKNRIDRIF